MTKPILSIVIPIYNAAAFLEQCLESVKTQITAECEAILVDDGSTDSSADIILNQLSTEINQGKFKLIRIDNSGCGQARNIGISQSEAEYIGFLDSDDFLLPGYIKSVIHIIKEYRSDIIQFHVLRVNNGETSRGKLVQTHSMISGRYKLEDTRNNIFGSGKWFACARVFRRDILLKHPFPVERIIYEDLHTIPFMFLSNYDIYLLDSPLYAYRDNPDSITGRHTPEHATTLLRLFNTLSEMTPIYATDILRVQIARSIVYFCMEMRIYRTQMWNVVNNIKSIKEKGIIIPFMRRPDELLLRAPLIYVAVDWIRHRVLSLRNILLSLKSLIQNYRK